MILKCKLVIAVLVILLASISVAQERQIPFDSQGTIYILNQHHESNLRLFTDYSGFQEARLFQIDDDNFVLEVYYQHQGQIYKKRIFLNAEQLSALRGKIADRLKVQRPGAERNEDARTKLVVGSLGLGIGYYGWAVPATLDVSDGKTALALYMLTSSATFFSTLRATRHYPVTDGIATLTMYGGVRGIFHGFALSAALFGDNSDSRATLALSILTSVGEALWDFHVADKNNMLPGTAECIGLGGDVGIFWGAGTASLADFYNDDNIRGMGALWLAGSGLGLWTGKWLSSQQTYTRGDAYVAYGTTVLGAYAPLVFADGFADGKSDAYWSATLLGSAVGLGCGHLLTSHNNFSTSQGTLINLGGVAGGLLGLGIAYLIADENNDNSTFYLGSSSLGAIGGFWAMYHAYSPSSAGIDQRSSALNMNMAITALPVPGPQLQMAPGIQIQWQWN
ncbi:hypothetical protein JW960_05075 [candidate division KSB1 bacterium]|nr:hypothetical protein [candidate division KSB1 bacterium]